MNGFVCFFNRLACCCGITLWLATVVSQAQTVQQLVFQGDRETDPIRAERWYTQALRLNPGAERVLLSRSVVRAQQERYQAALEDVSGAIALNDTVAAFYGQRAYILIQQSEYDAAVVDLNKAIRLSPRDARYHSSLSYCLLKQNHLDKAIRQAERGIQLDPASPYAYRNRGRARLYQGRTAEAVIDLERSLALKHAEPYRVLTDLGQAAEQQKNYQRANDYYGQALRLKPDYADALVRQHALAAVTITPTTAVPVGGEAQSTFTGKRVALIIGNADYPFIEPFLGEQPREDARSMNARLRELGFDTILKTNVVADSMRFWLDTFCEKAAQADMAAFYFAGHGLQYDGANYLLPVDIELYPGQVEQYVTKLTQQALLVTTVIERLQKARPRYCLVMLDACREDPLGGKRVNKPGSTMRLRPDPFVPIVVENFIRNCCVAQATTAGSRAWNGPNRNGCYTEALMKNMQRGAMLDQMLRRVRSDVMDTAQKAGKDQRPESLNQLTDDLIF